ncbi:hypothetical protein [Plantibacter sp. YIM 135249]|uniref:hypothetical protein n=1 Tax=Plantibacter sp. YIM 135249 TaxID=3423918 RepID=UPI003D341259
MPTSPRLRGSLAWEELDDGAVELSVPAVRMRMATLVITIVLIVLVLGATAVGFLITMDLSGVDVRRSLVVLVGGSLGIVASIALLLVMRARRQLWRIRIDAQTLSISSDRSDWSWPLAELRLVRLRRHTDYACLVVVGPTTRVSLLASIGLAADPRDTKAAFLPEFSADVQKRLRSAGLVERRSPKSPDLTDWRRPGGGNSPDAQSSKTSPKPR